MLERLAGHEYYCFLDGFSGYFQIPIAVEDQEKTTFTCPYGTFAYKQMPFGLYNAPAIFQCCVMAIFHDLIEDSMELFMDDFSIFGIILGHKVSKSGIEVDKEKIESISKVPYPTNVKAIRSFLGHAGFYQRFIKDFLQIARPMTQLLVKDTPFNFFEECIQAFDKLKLKLTQAPIMIKPDWSLPFEIMCNAKFDIEICDKKGVEDLAADHLSRLENPDLGTLTRAQIRDLFPENQLMTISNRNNEPWQFFWDEPFLFKQCADQIIRRCVAGDEAAQILQQCHSGPLGGHHGIATTARKVFEAKFYWPISFVMRENSSELVTRGIDFIRPFPSSNGNKYILVAIDYVYKWVEAQAFLASDARKMEGAMKRLFPGKLKSRWYGPFSISKDMRNGAIELCYEDGNDFIINKQRAKPYQKDALDFDGSDDINLEDEEGVT
ncbi:reverse transcriptase domain-containing protein [Tanacetum coccineum]